VTMHLFGAVVTSHGTAANNRGENEGNMTTLQKLLWNGDVHTTVSAEAIRWALRADWQGRGLEVNRAWREVERRHDWQDRDFAQNGRPYIDDDVLGYMSAQAARMEAAADEAPAAGKEVDADEASAERTGRGRRARGTATVRRSRLEVTRAVSVTPWSGDVVFNVAGVNATPSASRTGTTPVPYSGEVHATRYQYGFALTPDALLEPSRAEAVIDAIISLAEVAGNHARFYYDFAPDSVIFRWTHDPAPRLLYPFLLDDGGRLSVPELLRRARAGDVLGSELIIGGSLTETADAQALVALGAVAHAGVKAAATAVKQRIAGTSGA
jgi:CRISPR-associated protein Cst2